MDAGQDAWVGSLRDAPADGGHVRGRLDHREIALPAVRWEVACLTLTTDPTGWAFSASCCSRSQALSPGATARDENAAAAARTEQDCRYRRRPGRQPHVLPGAGLYASVRPAAKLRAADPSVDPHAASRLADRSWLCPDGVTPRRADGRFRDAVGLFTGDPLALVQVTASGDDLTGVIRALRPVGGPPPRPAGARLAPPSATERANIDRICGPRPGEPGTGTRDL